MTESRHMSRVSLECDVPPASRITRLSPRQHQVLSLVAEGKTDKEIATEVGLTVSTVQQHRNFGCYKLRIPNELPVILEFWKDALAA
jgi:DNA-binding NarL/FixJ family response regulator